MRNNLNPAKTWFIMSLLILSTIGIASANPMRDDSLEMDVDEVAELQKKRRSLFFQLTSSDTKKWSCREIRVKPQCADMDGCKVTINLTNTVSGVDDTIGIQESLYFESKSNSSNKHPGIAGYTRQAGGGEHRWRTGSNTRHTVFAPWGLVQLHNYRHALCPGQRGHGQVYKNPYKFNILVHPHINATIIVED